MTNLVFYHANCKDGFTAALAAWRRFGDHTPTHYIPIQYQQYEVRQNEGIISIRLFEQGTPIEIIIHHDVDIYILDFSLKYQEILALSGAAHRITLLDHHKTAQAELSSRSFPGNVDIRFDMNQSGCELAWDYFRQDAGAMPYWARLVGLRDLWKHKGTELEQSAEYINLALETYPLEFIVWDTLTMRELMDRGGHIHKYFMKLVSEIAVKHRLSRYVYDGTTYIIGVINAPYFMASELGNLIASARNFAVVYTIMQDNKVLCSFRSIGDVDVSVIAKRYGGGGHKNAAGCMIDNFWQFKQDFLGG